MIIGIPDENGTYQLPITALFNALDTEVKFFNSKTTFLITPGIRALFENVIVTQQPGSKNGRNFLNN
jgi:hypothetical protein